MTQLRPSDGTAPGVLPGGAAVQWPRLVSERLADAVAAAIALSFRLEALQDAMFDTPLADADHEMPGQQALDMGA